jgi:threonine dehydratase
MIDINKILAAPAVIDPVFLNSPLVGSPVVDDILGCQFLAKVETLNPIGSFKGRGTDLYVKRDLKEGETIVGASAGNFGQGLARAAAKRGNRCVIFAAITANPLKVEAMRQLGAEVRQEGKDYEEAKEAARNYALTNNSVFIDNGVAPAFVEGTGTIGLELAAQLKSYNTEIDALLVPLGDGTLLVAVTMALRHAMPSSRPKIVGVVPMAAPAMKLSFEKGEPVEANSEHTMADGISVRMPMQSSLDMLKGVVDVVEEVSEESIIDAVKLVARHLGIVLEASGAVGVAVLLSDQHAYKGKRVATILSGRNASPQLLSNVLVP